MSISDICKSTEIRCYRPLEIWTVLRLGIVPYLCWNISPLISSFNALLIFIACLIFSLTIAARIMREVSVCNTDTTHIITKPKKFRQAFFLSTADHIMTHFGPQAVEIVHMRLTDRCPSRCLVKWCPTCWPVYYSVRGIPLSHVLLRQLPSTSQASQLANLCFPAYESFPASGCSPLQQHSQCWPLHMTPNTL